LEFRLVLAYWLVAAIVLGLVIAGLIYRDKSIKRKRRLRGIKSSSSSRGSSRVGRS
jgi:Flp pilus assembly protein TadB